MNRLSAQAMNTSSLQYEYFQLPGVSFDFDYTEPRAVRFSLWGQSWDRLAHKPLPNYSQTFETAEEAHRVAHAFLTCCLKG